MTIKLWAHQQVAINRAKEVANIALFHEAGTGKTCTTVNILRDEYNKCRTLLNTLIFAPLSVCPQWPKAFQDFSKVDPTRVVVLEGTGRQKADQILDAIETKKPHILVTNYESVQNPMVSMNLMEFAPEVLVLDECFGKETLVDTPKGRVPIEKIKRGDQVLSAIGISEVKNVVQRYPQDYYILKINGSTIRVSPNHPFLTRRGWCSAVSLKKGDEIIRTCEAMRILWGEIYSGIPLSYKESAFLFWELRKEIGEPYAQQANEEESFSEATLDSAQTTRSWGKWTWTNAPGIFTISLNTVDSLEFCSGYETAKKFGIPHLLQVGSSRTVDKTGSGDRRSVSSSIVQERTGQEESSFFGVHRLESDPIYQCRSVEESREDCFYDLEIDGHPSFSVSGCLVHNCHKMKDSTGARFKKIKPIAAQARRKILLTGTPVLQSQLDLFGQFMLLDERVFGKNYFFFKNKYFYDANAGMPKHVHFPNWIPRPGSDKEISRLIAPHSVQAKKSECLDLPDLLQVTIPVTLSDDQAKAYAQMAKEFVAECDGKQVTAEFAMTKTLRLQQILCGFVQPDEGDDAAWFEDVPRLQALNDLLESLGGEKIIIWTNFKASYKQIAKICEKQGKKCVLFTGEQNAREKAEAKEAFVNGDAQIFVANPAAGGTGVDGLQVAKYAIYYSLGYSLGDYLQSAARNYRGGSEQHDKVTQYFFSATGTLDEIIVKALTEKRKIGEAILFWAKELTNSNGCTN